MDIPKVGELWKFVGGISGRESVLRITEVRPDCAECFDRTVVFGVTRSNTFWHYVPVTELVKVSRLREWWIKKHWAEWLGPGDSIFYNHRAKNSTDPKPEVEPKP